MENFIFVQCILLESWLHLYVKYHILVQTNFGAEFFLHLK